MLNYIIDNWTQEDAEHTIIATALKVFLIGIVCKVIYE